MGKYSNSWIGFHILIVDFALDKISKYIDQSAQKNYSHLRGHKWTNPSEFSDDSIIDIIQTLAASDPLAGTVYVTVSNAE